jgi:hypothetical protein
MTVPSPGPPLDTPDGRHSPPHPDDEKNRNQPRPLSERRGTEWATSFRS